MQPFFVQQHELTRPQKMARSFSEGLRRVLSNELSIPVGPILERLGTRPIIFLRYHSDGNTLDANLARVAGGVSFAIKGNFGEKHGTGTVQGRIRPDGVVTILDRGSIRDFRKFDLGSFLLEAPEAPSLPTHPLTMHAVARK